MRKISSGCVSLMLGVISAFLLLIAFIAEYKFSILPCSLCIYERYVYGVLAALSVLYYFIQNRKIIYLQFIALIVGVALSFYHVGVESHWWKGLESCSGSFNLSFTDKMTTQQKVDVLRQKLSNAPVVRCDEVNWRVFGISATIWNLLVFMGLIGLFIHLCKSNSSIYIGVEDRF